MQATQINAVKQINPKVEANRMAAMNIVNAQKKESVEKAGDVGTALTVANVIVCTGLAVGYGYVLFSGKLFGND